MPEMGLLIDWTQLEERIPELENMTIELPKLKAKKKRLEKIKME